jgi:hypothetical protein
VCTVGRAGAEGLAPVHKAREQQSPADIHQRALRSTAVRWASDRPEDVAGPCFLMLPACAERRPPCAMNIRDAAHRRGEHLAPSVSKFRACRFPRGARIGSTRDEKRGRADLPHESVATGQ